MQFVIMSKVGEYHRRRRFCRLRLERIANMYQRIGNIDKSLSALKQSLELDRREYPAIHPYIADRLAIISDL